MLAKRIQTAIRLPPELLEELKKEAKEAGVTVNALISLRLGGKGEKK